MDHLPLCCKIRGLIWNEISLYLIRFHFWPRASSADMFETEQYFVVGKSCKKFELEIQNMFLLCIYLDMDVDWSWKSRSKNSGDWQDGSRDRDGGPPAHTQIDNASQFWHQCTIVHQYLDKTSNCPLLVEHYLLRHDTNSNRHCWLQSSIKSFLDNCHWAEMRLRLRWNTQLIIVI